MLEKESNVKNSMQFNFEIQMHYGEKGIRSVLLQPSKKGFHWSFSSLHYDKNIENLVEKWIKAYEQKQVSDVQLPFDWTAIPSFTQQVLQFVATIPFGSVTTYGQIAHLLDNPGAARAVGGACGRNPFVLLIPCHRVLDAQQELRGYSAGGLSVKKELLAFEKTKS